MNTNTRRLLWIGGLVAGAGVVVGGVYLATRPPAPAAASASGSISLPILTPVVGGGGGGAGNLGIMLDPTSSSVSTTIQSGESITITAPPGATINTVDSGGGKFGQTAPKAVVVNGQSYTVSSITGSHTITVTWTPAGGGATFGNTTTIAVTVA